MAAVVQVDWLLPSYPDRIPRRSHVRVGGEAVAPILPIPRPPIPTVWPCPPVFPDRLIRHTLPIATLAGAVWPIFSTVMRSPLVWQAHYPDRIGRRTLPVAAVPFSSPFQIDAILQVAKTVPWLPHYPDRLLRRLPNRTIAAPVELIDPALIGKLGLDICVEFSEEALITPGLISEITTLPSLLAESAILPRFVEETVC